MAAEPAYAFEYMPPIPAYYRGRGGEGKIQIFCHFPLDNLLLRTDSDNDLKNRLCTVIVVKSGHKRYVQYKSNGQSS